MLNHIPNTFSDSFLSNEELWTNNLTELKTFIDLNKRRPAYNKESEKFMYKWLSHQLDNRKTKKEIRSNEDIRGLWDSFIKDYEQYFISNKELWTDNLTKLKTFIDLILLNYWSIILHLIQNIVRNL